MVRLDKSISGKLQNNNIDFSRKIVEGIIVLENKYGQILIEREIIRNWERI